MNNTEKTLAYYNEKASTYTFDTIDVEFMDIQNAFLSQVKNNGKILDLGCGSGRDSKYFKEKGYSVTAVDGSSELCKIASSYIGQKVICSTFQNYSPIDSFDGIWACASLLHLSPKDIKSIMNKLSNHLVSDGCFYASFKYGNFSGERNKRYFTDFTEESFETLLSDIPELYIDHISITSDVRVGRDSEQWLNVYLKKRK